MHEVQFADAVRPARVVILKLLMLPYSVGHEILLFRQRNPLVVGNLTSDNVAAALIKAADICSMTWAENGFIPQSWWQKRRTHKVWTKWECSMRGTDWPAETEKFVKYVRDGSAAPPVQSPDGPGGREMGAPFMAGLIQFLIGTMKVHPDGIYDFPLGLAKFHYYTSAEAAGGVCIVNRPELEFEEYCRREDEKAARQKAGEISGTRGSAIPTDAKEGK